MSHLGRSELLKNEHVPSSMRRNYEATHMGDMTPTPTRDDSRHSKHSIRKWENLTGREFTTGPKIAGGGFSTVYKGMLRRDGCPSESHPVAIKQMSEMSSSKEQKDEFMAELYAMTKCGMHPNIVHLYGACIHTSRQSFLMELCHGSLQDRLESGPPSWIPKSFRSTNRLAGGWPLPFLVHWASGAASALRHIHSLRVFHRDIKAANFLMRAPTSTVQNELSQLQKRAEDIMNVITSNKKKRLDALNTRESPNDRGVHTRGTESTQKEYTDSLHTTASTRNESIDTSSHQFPPLQHPPAPEQVSLDRFGRPLFTSQFGYLPCVENVILSDFGLVGCESVSACTPTHAAPELLSGKGFGRGVDIWAFGVLLIELFTMPGDPKPFVNWRISDIINAVLHNRVKPSTRYLRFDTPHAIRQLINQCLAYDPQDRPSADDICTHLRQLQYSSTEFSLPCYFAEYNGAFVVREKQFNVVPTEPTVPEPSVESKGEDIPPVSAMRPKSAATLTRFTDLNSRGATAQLPRTRSSLYDYKRSERKEDYGKHSDPISSTSILRSSVLSAYTPSYASKESKSEESYSYTPSFGRLSSATRPAKETEASDTDDSESSLKPTPTPDLPDYLRPVSRETRHSTGTSRPFTAPTGRSYRSSFAR